MFWENGVKKSQWKEIMKRQLSGHLHHTPLPPNGGCHHCGVSGSSIRAKHLEEKTVSLLDPLEISKRKFFFNICDEHKGFDSK